MKISRNQFSIVKPFLFFSLSTTLSSAVIAATVDQQTRDAESIRVPVVEFIPKELIKDSTYQLQPEATIHRSYATFQLKADSGTTQITGTTNLLERIAELKAIETLKKIKKTDVYTKALKSSALGPVETGKGLLTEPVDTISDAAKGLGGLFADIGYSIVSDDPSQENVAKTMVGFGAAQRQLAFTLGVNPYSDYQPLQDELSEVAWTSVGGGMTVAVGFSAIGGTPGTVVSLTSSANTGRKLVRDNSPRKLDNLNHDSLVSMGVKEPLAEAFLNNYNYNPESETRIVTAISSMKGVQGRADLVARASTVASAYEASQMRDWAELLAAFHAKVKPVKEIIIVSTAPFLVAKDGSVIGVFPTDYVVDTPGFKARIKAVVGEIESRGLKVGGFYATGKIHPGMSELLTSVGWSDVHDHIEKTLQTP
jgi:hypothetical protein